MTGNEPSAVARDVRTLLSVGAVGGLTDGQLLERFVTRRGDGAEAAFSALVQRHGPLVWGVCLRTLDDPHDAADAFQATFLVLVRKAGTVRVDDTLGRWLYGVSRRVATRARAANARRSSRETSGVQAAAVEGSDPFPSTDRTELLAGLDEEIGRLPERYRAAVVLCDLGGATHEEASRQLGCAVGTVGSRLSRGRERLRARLTRRGLAPLAGLLGSGLAAGTAPAAPPAGLMNETARAALRVAAGESAAVAANVEALSKGVLKAMLMSRWKLVAAFALTATAGLAALALAAAPRPAAPPAAGKDDAPAAVSAERVIAAAARTYSEARSYEDEGEVVLVFISPAGRRTVKRPFSTKFVRPKLYRYEFSERAGDGEGERNRYVIWSDAAPGLSKRWWTVQPEIEEGPLNLAIAGATGVSGGSAFTIPHLLMPAVLPSLTLAGLKDFKPVGEETIERALCDRIEGTTARGNPETVWIDRATSLVRKIFSTNTVPGATVEETTTYRPRVNVEIPADRFEFVPPKP